jgi:RimJ/RimL family protein N-acetyltransferase
VRDGRLAGGCGLHRRGGPNTLEIGYWTHPAFLRLGVARTAARLLTELAFTVPGIERVEIHHDKANQASAGVPRSLGYRPIGEQPDTPPSQPSTASTATWRITRDEWLNAK